MKSLNKIGRYMYPMKDEEESKKSGKHDRNMQRNLPKFWRRTLCVLHVQCANCRHCVRVNLVKCFHNYRAHQHWSHTSLRYKLGYRLHLPFCKIHAPFLLFTVIISIQIVIETTISNIVRMVKHFLSRNFNHISKPQVMIKVGVVFLKIWF